MRVKVVRAADVRVIDRLRSVDEDHAQVLAKSIEQLGLFNPMTLRRTSASPGGAYTLVAGAYRLRAVQMLGRPEIEALIVRADGAEAQLLEIHEIFSRNDLSASDRARFVARLRELWEDMQGEPINPKGGRHRHLAGGFVQQVCLQRHRICCQSSSEKP